MVQIVRVVLWAATIVVFILYVETFGNFYLRFTITNFVATTMIMTQDIYDQYMIVKKL